MQKLIPQSFIQDVVSRTDIISVIQSRVELKKRGGTYVACCPFHSEKTPSFTVSHIKQFYYCFGCGAHGNVIGFLMNYDHLPFVEAVAELAQSLGLTIPLEGSDNHRAENEALYTLMHQAQMLYEAQLKKSPVAIDYLKNRGLTGAVAKQFGIGFSPNEWEFLSQQLGKNKTNNQNLMTAGLIIEKNPQHYYDRFRNRIMFPIRDVRGKTIAFGGRTITDETPKYLNSPETPVFHKNQTLYGLYEMCQQHQKLSRIVMVEGYLDVIALAQHGIHYATATLGTALNVQHIKILLRYTAKIIFCFDGDDAGRKAAWKALIICLPLLRDGLDFQFLFLPQNEDPDSWVRKIGKAAFEIKIDGAQALATVFFSELEKTHPVDTIAGKAAFAKQATDYLNTMPEGIYKNLLFTELSAKIQVGKEKIVLPKKNMAAKLSTHTLPKRLNPAQTVMQILLHHPALASDLTLTAEHIHEKTLEKNMLCRLLQHCKSNVNFSVSDLLAEIEQESDRALIASIAAHPLHIPESGRKTELIDACARLQVHHDQEQVGALIEKAKIAALTDIEKQQLKMLLEKRKVD